MFSWLPSLPYPSCSPTHPLICAQLPFHLLKLFAQDKSKYAAACCTRPILIWSSATDGLLQGICRCGRSATRSSLILCWYFLQQYFFVRSFHRSIEYVSSSNISCDCHHNNTSWILNRLFQLKLLPICGLMQAGSLVNTIHSIKQIPQRVVLLASILENRAV